MSGGQTGVDRAALDFAIRCGIDHGGWCPLGRRAEDGPIPMRYRLRETVSSDYEERTDRNVVDSDATLIIVRDEPLSGGTKLTLELALQHGRPVLVVRENDGLIAGASAVAGFLVRHGVRTLNVAGPRESECSGISGFVGPLLQAANLVQGGGGSPL